jgi:SH3-like domain-containing protein
MIAAAPSAAADRAVKSPGAGASGLPVPRFVSLSSDKVNMRAGPGVRYPIAWVYRRKGTPLIVTAEFEYWRKVRDASGTEGWMHRSLLSGRRMAVVQGKIAVLRRDASTSATPLLRAEPGVLARLQACQRGWCRLAFGDREGWLRRDDIFGALPNEDFQ